MVVIVRESTQKLPDHSGLGIIRTFAQKHVFFPVVVGQMRGS